MTKMHTERCAGSQNLWLRRHALAAAVMALSPLAAMAEVNFGAGVSGTEEYDSNLFRLSPDATPPGGGSRSERISIGAVDANLEGKFGDQRLYLQGKGQRFYYDHYDDLNHNEYDGNGGLDWRAGQLFDGKLSYQQSRSMVSEEARATPSTELSLQTNRNANAGINLNITPEWRVETRAGWLKQDSPSPSVFFQLDEDNYALGLKYLGMGDLAMGVEVEYLDGHFSAPVILPPPALPGPPQTTYYKQTGENLTIDYNVSGLSKLSAKLGTSQRRVDGDDSQATDGFTGELQYKRTISALTKFTGTVFRRLQSYASLNDYVTETGGTAQVEWQPTPNIYTSLLGQYIQDEFNATGRKDRLALADASLSYQVFRNFQIKPDVRYENRHSSDGSYQFNDTVYSLQARLFF